MKKPWSRPKLVVLARGKPQEAVLQVCKHPTKLSGAPVLVNNLFCFYDEAHCYHCHDSAAT